MTRPEATRSRAATAAFFLFAAGLVLGLPLGATRAEASPPRSTDATALNVVVPDTDSLDGEVSATILRGAVAADVDDVALEHSPDRAPCLGFAEDLCLLEPDHGQASFAIFGRETCRCERTYARNNPLKYVDPDGNSPLDITDAPGIVAEAAVDTVNDLARGLAAPMLTVGAGILNDDPVQLALGTGELLVAGAFEGVGLIRMGARVTLSVGKLAPESAGEAAVPTAARSAGSLVHANKTRGDAFRDSVVAGLKAQGREVATEVPKRTPFGTRVIDVEVRDKGKALGGIETKTGGSRYTPAQRAKDEYLRRVGYPVIVVRE